MYKYKLNRINLSGSAIKYQFLKISGENLTYSEFINLLKCQDKDFFSVFKRSLKDANSKFPAYFWECPPVSQETLNKPFEFVVTKSQALNSIKQNYTSFNEYFSGGHNGNVCSFPSLGNDATLIVPIPKSKSNYKNISQFTNNAPDEQQQIFWQEVANKLEKSLDNNSGFPKWLSTNGLSVHYLHVRIDSRPKYYSWKEYWEEATVIDSLVEVKRKKTESKFEEGSNKKRFQGNESISINNSRSSTYDNWTKEQFIVEIERLKTRVLELENIASEKQEKKEELEKNTSYISVGSKSDGFQ